LTTVPRRLTKAHLSELPSFVSPELATLVNQPLEGGAWLHEIKLDGYRTGVRIERGKVRLLTRTGLDWTARFRPIATALALATRQGARMLRRRHGEVTNTRRRSDDSPQNHDADCVIGLRFPGRVSDALVLAPPVP
jgi:hypothetical protein